MGLLGVSVVGTYWSENDEYRAYREQEFPELEERIKKCTLVVGFNNKYFDFPVLQPYMKISLSTIPMLDIMDDLAQGLGHRVSLESVAQGTLGVGKMSSGLQAIRWWREGNFDDLIKYCLQDVKLTREVYEYGRAHGYVKFFAGWATYEVPVKWR